MKKGLGMALLGAGGILMVAVLRNVAQILSADATSYSGRLAGHLMWQAALLVAVYFLFKTSFRLLGPRFRRNFTVRRLAGSFPQRAKMKRA